MPRVPLFAVLLVLCLLAACGSRTPEPEPSPTPTQTPTPTPEPTETADEPQAGDPVTVEVDYVEPQLLDNAVLRGEEQRQPSPETIDHAVTAATRALEAYLNRQFIEPSSRFGSAAIEGLLLPEALERLDEEQRRGLGELPLSPSRTDADPVVAQAVVLTDGDDLLSVTLAYTLTVRLTGDGDGDVGDLHQEGRLLFPAQGGDDWRAEMVELTLTAPEGDA